MLILLNFFDFLKYFKTLTHYENTLTQEKNNYCVRVIV